MPLPATCAELASLLEYPLLSPTLTGEQVVEGLNLSRRLSLGAAVVRSCDIDLAVRTLSGSGVRAAAVCGFPHGTQNTATKLYEARDLLRRGARQVDLALGACRLLSREFQHVQTELVQMGEACRQESASLTVILESAWLSDELKIIACRAAERAEADFVATGSGFAGGPATPAEVALLRRYVPEEMSVKAVGPATLDAVLEAIGAGAGRILTGAPESILDEWKRRQTPPPVPAAS